MTSSNTDLIPSTFVNGFPLMNYIIMAGQSHTTHTHFLICMDLFCTNCQCFRPKKEISGSEFQTEVCDITFDGQEVDRQHTSDSV